MGRCATFDAETLLRGARDLLDERGPAQVTIQAVCGAVGAPVGSIYHRFRSRAALLGTLWLDAAEDFQAAFVDATADPGGGLARPGALAAWTVDWARRHRDDARLLLLFRREELLLPDAPPELAQRAGVLGAQLREVHRRMTVGWLGRYTTRGGGAVRLAVFELPQAAVRTLLRAGRPFPRELERWTAAAAEAVIATAIEED